MSTALKLTLIALPFPPSFLPSDDFFGRLRRLVRSTAQGELKFTAKLTPYKSQVWLFFLAS